MNKMKLGDLIEITSGYAWESKYFNENEVGFPLIRIRNVETGKTDTYYSGEPDNEYVIQKGDLLVTMDGKFIAKKWEGSTGLLNQRVCKIKVKNSNLLPEYLKYFLPRELKLIEDKTSYVTVKHLSIKKIKEIDILLPNLDTQQKIISVLDKARKIIIDRQQQLQEMEELQKSQFNKMFNTEHPDWKKVSLKEVSTVRSSKRVFKKDLVDSGVPFFRGNEIKTLAEGKKLTPNLFITKEHFKKLKEDTDVPSVGDILLPSICPNGEIWRVNTDADFYFKDGRVLWIKFDDFQYNDIYIHHAIKNQIIRNYSKIASGTTFSELKIFSLKELEIIIPPLKEQNKYASFVKKVEAQKQKMQESLDLMEDNFNALMQKAFSGELVSEEESLVK